MRAALLALCLLAVPLTGCFGSDGGDERILKARAEVGSDVGAIQGVVTDAAIQPVVGANLTLSELSRTTRTLDDGSYAFSNLVPGTYTLLVQAEGLVSRSETVSVTANRVTVLDLVLARLFTEEAFTQAWELAGFFECGFAVGLNLSAAPAPANVSTGILSYPVCAEVNDQLGNTTNDRWSHFFDLEPPIESLVVETVWDPSVGSLSDQIWVDMVPQGFHCGSIVMCDWSLIDHWGPSPLQGRVDVDRFESVQEHFHTSCTEGEDEWCGYNFFDTGWPLWIRVYPRWECQPVGPQGCIMVQQSFEHVLTAFYNTPAPEGFTALS